MRRRRGVALVLSMLVSSLLVMMVGAYFQVNRDSMQTYGVSLRQRQAFMAAQSGLAYARLQIEHNSLWGHESQPFTNAERRSVGEMSIQETGASTLRGNFAGARDGQHFEVQVYNNLGLSQAARTINGVEVPADACKLFVTGHSTGFKSRLCVVLTGEPLYDASAVSQGVLDMSGANKWNLRSRDPRRNWVRSNTSIITPNVFTAPSNMTFDNSDTGSPIQGVAWSRGDIKVGNSSGPSVSTDLAAAVSNANGQFSPNSNLKNDIYRLTRDSLKFPSTTKSINPGRYVISDVSVTFTTPVEFTVDDGWFDWGEEVSTTNTFTGTLKTLTYYPPSGAPVVWYYDRDMSALQSAARSNARGIVPRDADDVSVGTPGFTPPGTSMTDARLELNGAGNGFSFDFESNTFHLDNGNKYEVGGDFEVGYNLSDGSLSEAAYRPRVNFADGSSVAALSVTGRVDVSGEVTGKAAIAATGDINFVSSADAEASTVLPVVLHSEGSINIKTPPTAENFFMKGLVYAGQNFTVSRMVPPSPPPPALPTVIPPLQQVQFDGAVVAQSGEIRLSEVGAANRVDFIYNPEYLNTFTYGIPGNRRRLKQASFSVL